ncbi:hypothetical protein [Vibrio mediterranei]|uniref:hypothetical protein n=1 Tax=Vibrio mediterranei TaxID=689 RepID=UPI00148D46A0|nr:hypothetical protein [Vibrio mediterranei]NOH31678.1 hypothetical protein [Vibrio mediterranei]
MISLITALLDKCIGYFQRKQEIKAKIERIKKGDESASKLDELSIKQRGWKDEYLLILTTIPLGLSFVPDYASVVQMGFDALAMTPEYYWYSLGMIYIDTFGFRRMVRVAFEHWLQKRFGGVNG